MYYPYLRAKQYELKALREFSSEHEATDKIVPILEPVKQQTNSLKLAIDEMVANRMRFALIMNPQDGDFKHPTVHFDALKSFEKLNEQSNAWIPAFIYSMRNTNKILEMIQSNYLEHVMIILRTGNLDESILDLVKNEAVDYVVYNVDNVSRHFQRQLGEANKKKIKLGDCFKTKPRNADYALEIDEYFSDAPFYYKEDDFHGYSDYTTLPAEYIEGGMLPYALAIHLSYKKNADQLFVHHFVSDNNQTNSDIRGKFSEAAKKVAPFFEDKPHTASVDEIIEKANDPDGYPGLGYLKKLSVKNHLELILSL